MSTLLIVGADHLGSIPKKLEGLGFNHITHLNGRKVQSVKRDIPSNTDLILVLTDYINHNLTAVLKRKALEQDIPICYAKRSWCSIYRAMGKCDSICLPKGCPFKEK